MTWIASKGEKSVTINASLEKVFEYLSNYENTGRLFPGVEKMEKQGEGVYHFILEEKSTAGLKFRGDYVLRYEHNGKDEVRWTPVSGNVKSTGRWRLRQEGAQVVATVTVDSEADAPVPSLMKAIAKPFAQSELDKGLAESAARLKRAVESA